ncbi:aspartate-alanine antiporter [Microvirga terricola]|uniref:Aspartate-alanine antiporter n=1 Tax=Microvirga terricola TaxID=2719797 RepID=A0ABX0VD60_9HYPH|nr:aspartate-alanine antiporter [Microvirga terricola]NIX77769.1 aspartate-alanine antiporter [Microvirga terricola]
MWDWFVHTLRTYPEIAIFLSLAIGYFVGGFTFKGLGLGTVTSTLLAAILIGQLGITVSPTVKSVFFLMFLFAIGYGVGPQFVRGIAKDGLPQAIFSLIMAIFCLVTAYIAARIAGYDLGSAAGLYAGATTISASMGLATDAINRIGLPADQTKQLLDAIPVAYAVTYIFGTIGSAIILALIGPALLGIDLEAECKRYEKEHGGKVAAGGEGTAWHRFELRAFRIDPGSIVIGKTAREAEALAPQGARVFIERIRRAGKIQDATEDTVLQAGDVVAIAGRRDVLVSLLSPAEIAARLGTETARPKVEEVDDRELLAVPAGGVDVYVTSKDADGKTLAQLANLPMARGVFLRKITRGPTATDIPILPDTTVHRGDILTLVGRTQDITGAGKALGYIDKATDVTDVAFVGAAITIGALIGALVFKMGGIPLTLSTSGGALIAGLFFGWLRSVHPTFGRIPSSTVWFMNSVGLNVFIAVVGISSGPSFVAGLQQLGISLFLWGILVTTIPLILGIYMGKYVFRFDPAILLGCCAGARTTTAALGMITERAKSQIPGLGYTVTYAIGNTVLTIWGMIIVMLLS